MTRMQVTSTSSSLFQAWCKAITMLRNLTLMVHDLISQLAATTAQMSARISRQHTLIRTIAGVTLLVRASFALLKSSLS